MALGLGLNPIFSKLYDFEKFHKIDNEASIKELNSENLERYLELLNLVVCFYDFSIENEHTALRTLTSAYNYQQFEVNRYKCELIEEILYGR